jgi:ABC-type branched-subunit amino acid transport system ATPase component
MPRKSCCADSRAADALPTTPLHGLRAEIATMNMVELRQVSKRYGTVDALSAVDLVIRKGEFVTLLGPSGSGKPRCEHHCRHDQPSGGASSSMVVTLPNVRRVNAGLAWCSRTTR